MARPFKICPDCGAHLDASEPCDCKDAIEREPPKPRAQFNPELRYFTTTTARWDRYGEVMAGILKRRTVSRADLDNIGGICEI